MFRYIQIAVAGSHQTTNNDCSKRFCEEMLQKVSSDETFLDSVCFSDGATFHLDGTVNRRNCRIQGGQSTQEIINQKDTSKVNVWCGIM
jgi:hypothetical protein